MQEMLRDEGKQQQLDHGKDDDQRRNHDRHDGPRANGRAGRNRRGHAADRNARRHRRRPLATEAKIFTGNEIHQRPVDEVSLNDGTKPAEHDRLGQPHGLGAFHAECRPQQDDRNFDVQLRPDCVLHQAGQARKKISDNQTGDQRDNETRFTGEIHRPRDAELFQFNRRRCDVSVRPDREAAVADEKHESKSVDEFAEPDPQPRFGDNSEQDQ